MGMINCPECQNEVSDKAESCPKCGYPIAKSQSAGKSETTAEELAKRKKLITKICIGIGILLVLCVAAGVIYYFANKENISVSKAQQYTQTKQYDKVIELLEPYKERDKAKELYDNAVFLTSDEGKFIQDLAQGLEERWKISEINDNAEGKELVDAEWNKIGQYENVTFSDETFNEKAHSYIDALKIQKSALDYYTADYTKYINMWGDGLNKRSVLIAYFLDNYPVPIDDKYADVKADFQSTAQGIKAQQEFEDKIDVMIHKNNFTKTDKSSTWKEYSITITNETDKTFQYFGLYVNCLDADGNILAQPSTNQIKDYAPGQTATFEFSTDKNPESLTWSANYYVE